MRLLGGIVCSKASQNFQAYRIDLKCNKSLDVKFKYRTFRYRNIHIYVNENFIYMISMTTFVSSSGDRAWKKVSFPHLPYT
jgi:hypothetical protein